MRKEAKAKKTVNVRYTTVQNVRWPELILAQPSIKNIRTDARKIFTSIFPDNNFITTGKVLVTGTVHSSFLLWYSYIDKYVQLYWWPHIYDSMVQYGTVHYEIIFKHSYRYRIDCA